jgi:superfamily II DNA or RNA helicase
VSSPPNTGAPRRAEDARSVLMDTIRQFSIGAHFSRAAQKTAESLASHAQAWREPLAWFQPEGSAADALQCEFVEEGGTYGLVNVYLYSLFGHTTLESACTCGQSLCPHAAAVLIRLQRLVDWPRAMTPLQRWQRSIENYRESPPPEAPTTDMLESRRLVCLLQAESGRRPTALSARLVLVDTADPSVCRGPWLAIDTVPNRALLSPRAMMWQARLAMGQRSERSGPSGHLLEGHTGAALLAEFLERGICYYAESLQKIYAGVARPPLWRWSHDDLAQAHLELTYPDATVRLIDLDGLHYLDEVSGEFGPLKLTRIAWSMLEHLPPIPPGETEFRVQWPPHPLLRAVPQPPPAPALREIHVTPDPVLVIGGSRHTDGGDYVFHLHAWADYGGCRLPLASDPWRQQIVRRVLAEYVTIRRDVDREASAWQALADAGIVSLRKVFPDARRSLMPVPDADALGQREHFRGGAETFAALESLVQSLSRAGFRLEYDPELPFAVLPSDTELQATLNPGKQFGWTQFELAAAFDEGEINILPVILDGLTRKAFALTPAAGESPDAHWLAPVGPYRFLPLPLSRLREWLAPLVECLDRPNRRSNARLNLSRSQAMALSECLQRQGIALGGIQAMSIADTLAALRAAQRSASSVECPASFHGVLRGYQREGLQWLQALRQSRLGGVLADDMGLGKTVQVIAHLLLELESGRLDRPALIVVPTSLAFNWVDEIARFAPALRCLNFTGPERAARRDKLLSTDVIIVSYALLVNEMVRLEDIDYSMLVLDEAQWIKNPVTQTARAVRRLRASHRLALTGTPLENHLGELWAHLDAVLPGILGDYRSFSRSFRVPIERHEDDARMAVLRQRVAPFLLRRSKASVAPELPSKTETVLRVAMAEGQRRLYESLRLSLSKQVRDALARYNDEQSRIVVLSALLRLRQVCCDPRLVGVTDARCDSAKLDALLELIRSLRQQGRQVLVFSQFTSMLELISQALHAAHLKHVVLTGKTADRRAPVRRFQGGDVRIMLASLKAGGVGLNLTAADAVIHYDPWWNPAVELQAVDRAHRLGREQPIFVYKLLCDDTIEDKIEAMKERKSDLAGALLGETGSSSTRLDELDVRELFKLPGASR